MRASNMEHPLVTVVTPSFNQAEFIEQAILSVVEQDYQRIEYLVIDGASTDGSVEIIKKYQSQISGWVSEPDKGQADAINKGWSRSSGEILAFLNSDDYYYPGAITKAVAAFTQNPHVGMVCGQGVWVSEGGERLRTIGFRMDSGAYPELYDLYTSSAIPQPAAFVRRSVIEKVGMLDASFHYGLDGEFFLRVLGNFTAVAVEEPFAAMRVQSSSKSVSSGVGFAPEIIRLVENAISNPEVYPRFRIVPGRARAAAHILAGRVYYMNGYSYIGMRELMRSAMCSLRYWPLLLGREFPRLCARGLLGRNIYNLLSTKAA